MPDFFIIGAVVVTGPALKKLTVSETARATFLTPQIFVFRNLLHKTYNIFIASFWFWVMPS